MALFESYERRIDKINGVLAQYGISSVEECRTICQEKGYDPYEIVKGIQPICFENACWAYTVGAAIALKKNVKTAAEAAEAIGIGLQAFCIDGSVAEDRKVGLGHGNLGAMLLRDETKCFAFLAGHESFAAAEGAIGIARSANKARKEPLRVILNGLGKDAAQIISRINGFTYVSTDFDFATGTLKVTGERKFSDGERAAVKCYGANDVLEGVEIMKHEGVDVSITGNSTNYGLWSDADYDAIIDECTTGDLCTDPEGRWAALYEAEQIVLEQAVIFPLYGQCNAEMVSSAVTGVAFHPVALNRVYKNAAKSE